MNCKLYSKSNEFRIRPLHQLQERMCYSSRDWSLDEYDSWIYGIVVGWGCALKEISRTHGWQDDEVEYLKLARRKFLFYKRKYEAK